MVLMLPAVPPLPPRPTPPSYPLNHPTTCCCDLGVLVYRRCHTRRHLQAASLASKASPSRPLRYRHSRAESYPPPVAPQSRWHSVALTQSKSSRVNTRPLTATPHRLEQLQGFSAAKSRITRNQLPLISDLQVILETAKPSSLHSPDWTGSLSKTGQVWSGI